jgi:uncharacterized membrane protein YbaN (DUF454 family)
MNIQLTRIYAVAIGAVGIIGLFVSGHLFLIMNTDWAIDILRIALAAYLAWAGFMSKEDRAVNMALYIVGALYVVMGVIGLFSSACSSVPCSGYQGIKTILFSVQ